MSPGDGCGPALDQQDGAESTTRTTTDQGNGSTVESTVRPLAVTIIGADALHRLTAAGYRVAGVCRGCGAPLVDPVSIARGLGPVCAGRTEGAA